MSHTVEKAKRTGSLHGERRDYRSGICRELVPFSTVKLLTSDLCNVALGFENGVVGRQLVLGGRARLHRQRVKQAGLSWQLLWPQWRTRVVCPSLNKWWREKLQEPVEFMDITEASWQCSVFAARLNGILVSKKVAVPFQNTLVKPSRW